MAALDLPPETRTLPLRELRDLIERQYILSKLDENGWNISAPPGPRSSAPTCTRRCARSASPRDRPARARTGLSDHEHEGASQRAAFVLRSYMPERKARAKAAVQASSQKIERCWGQSCYRKVEEGFFVIKQGSSRVMIRVHPWKDHAVIRLAAQLVKGVRMEAPLALELLELNAVLRFGSFAYVPAARP